MLKKTIVTSFCVLALGSVSQAQLVTNSFTGTFNWSTNGNVSSFAYNGAAIPDVSVGNALKVGIVSSSSSGNFRGTSWPTNASIDTGFYIEFSLTANTGTLEMSSVNFGLGRSGTGPVSWEWRSSLDSFAAPLTSYSLLNTNLALNSGVITSPDLNANFAGNTLDLSGGGFTGLSAATFRFYGYASEGAAGSGGLAGDLTFSGASVVPEPSTYAMLALAGAGLAGYTIRRRRR